jgi:hypothetical protein
MGRKCAKYLREETANDLEMMKLDRLQNSAAGHDFKANVAFAMELRANTP